MMTGKNLNGLVHFVAMAIVGLFAVAFLVLLFVPVPAPNAKNVDVIVMALVAQFSAVVGYYFGSSHLHPSIVQDTRVAAATTTAAGPAAQSKS